MILFRQNPYYLQAWAWTESPAGSRKSDDAACARDPPARMPIACSVYSPSSVNEIQNLERTNRQISSISERYITFMSMFITLDCQNRWIDSSTSHPKLRYIFRSYAFATKSIGGAAGKERGLQAVAAKLILESWHEFCRSAFRFWQV